MGIHRPFPLRFHAHIASLCLRVQEEAVVGDDHRLFEAHATKLMQCHADQLERAWDQAQRRFRVAFQLAVDFRGAQHQQVDGFGNLRLTANKVVQRHFREAIAIPLGQHIHALRDVAYRSTRQLRYQ